MNYDLMIQTSYSLNGSLIDVEVLVQKASVEGYKTLGLVDQGVMYAAIKFSEACIAANIKPIIGLEFPITGVFGKSSTLIAYAKNQNGYQNLIQISSHINTLSTPITLEMLLHWSTGLFFVQSPSKGDFYQTALDQDFDTATYLVGQYNKYLHEWYLGIDLGNFEVETIVAPWYEQLGNTLIINQVSYYQSSDKTAANILSQILKDTISMESGLFTTEAVDQSLLSIAELNTRYKGYEEAILRTKQLIDSITWVIPIGQRHLPKYPLPTDELPSVFLSRLARRGLDRRYAQMMRPKATFDVYLKRLLFELSMIEKMGFEDYFLIVWDFVLFAKRSQILVGPGRGSAAGSLVSYVLGIVDVDPLEHGLFFERFLNPERITMPDIDMDFPDDRRDEVIRYVVDKYGKNHVTNIVAFGTFQGKSAIRDVGRILKMPDSTLSEISEYLSSTNNSIQDFIQHQPQKYQNLIENKEVAFLFDIASKLINLPKHIGTHAAGIIITQENVLAYSPVQNGLLDMYQTQYEATDLELIGLNKIDFLGIRNLKTIQKVVELIKETTSEVVDVYKIPFDDSKTFSLLQDVHSLGIFQLESDGMMNLMRKMQLSTFDDISLCIALFRPGPMENIPTYLKRRFHQEKVEYLHPILQPILEGTKGVIVYQEQIMQIARDFAAYSLGEADVLRRAVSKKSDAILQAERAKFVSKSLKQGHSEQIANEIYDYIVKFANYGFNKSHSVAYALVAYWMAYLKANYPTAFMAVLMDSVAGSLNATSEYIKECRRLGIEVKPPHINESSAHYRLEEGQLRYPFLGIRSIGETIAQRLVEIQSLGPITSFLEFIRRGKDINNRAIESLIMAGVFDGFGQNKRTLIENLKPIIRFAELGDGPSSMEFMYTPYEEYEFDYLQQSEKELLGFSMQYHPLNQYLSYAKKHKICLPSEIVLDQVGPVRFIGVMQRIKTIQTKSKEPMSFIEIEDHLQTIEAVLFPKKHLEYHALLKRHQVYVFSGTLEVRNHQSQCIIDRIEQIEE